MSTDTVGPNMVTRSSQSSSMPSRGATCTHNRDLTKDCQTYASAAHLTRSHPDRPIQAYDLSI